MDQERIHPLLLLPSFYPEQPAAVAFQETHISRVYLMEEYVYKMKKPVSLGFLDFSTLERRSFFCREEVRLNSRFSPDVYLGVVPVCMEDGKLHIGPPGEPVEYLVKMRRLPEGAMLHRMIGADAADLPAGMIRLGKRLADLHLAEPACNHDEGYSDLMHVRRNWEENFRQTEPFIGTATSPEGFSALRNWVRRFLEDHDGVIDRRERDGWVRECHGDLHAEHVCLTDPIRIYDCIEFNRRFRVSDILADTAFLLMDLDRRGRPDLAEILRLAYIARLGSPAPDNLLRFYKVYRASVRGKVASILSAQQEIATDRREHARQEALAYFNLALGYTAPPSLLITCGLMGTGKTRLALELAKSLHAAVIRSDIIRMQFKERPDAGADAGFLQGPYRRGITEQVYRLLAEEARGLLKAGQTVILDASFAGAAERRRMRDLAAEYNVPFAVLHCTVPDETALARLRSRREEGRNVSDGRVELYDSQKAGFEAPSGDEPVIVTDTSGPSDYSVNILLGRLHGIFGAEHADLSRH